MPGDFAQAHVFFDLSANEKQSLVTPDTALTPRFICYSILFVLVLLTWRLGAHLPWLHLAAVPRFSGCRISWQKLN